MGLIANAEGCRGGKPHGDEPVALAVLEAIFRPATNQEKLSLIEAAGVSKAVATEPGSRGALLPTW